MLDVGCWGQKAGWQVHAYGLMRNHYPVVLETPNANLVAGRACSRRRRRAGWRRRRPGRGFAGAGVWAARSSSARCWRKWKAGAASPIRASCAASRPKRRRSALLAKNSAAWGGVGPNWPPGTRVIPASWRWRHGCARRQRTRARVLPPGCIWVTSKRANARQHQFMVPPPPSDPRQSQLRL